MTRNTNIFFGFLFVLFCLIAFPYKASAVLTVTKNLDSEDTTVHFFGKFDITGTSTTDVPFSVVWWPADSMGNSGVHETSILGTRLHTTPASTPTTISFEILYNNNPDITPDTSYVYDVRNHTTGASYYSDMFQSPPPPPTPITYINSSSSGLLMSLIGGERTITTFTGGMIVTASQATTAAFQVIWGESETTLSNVAPVYLGATGTVAMGNFIFPSGSSEEFHFKLEGLTGDKKYYYSVTKNGQPNERYTQIREVDVHSGGTGTGTGTGGTGTTGGTSDQGPIEGGLVPCDGSPEHPCRFTSLIDLVNRIIQYLIYLMIPLAAIVFAYAGFILITQGGSPAARETAKGMFIKVVIGLIFVLGAWLIMSTIMTALGLKEGFSFF